MHADGFLLHVLMRVQIVAVFCLMASSPIMRAEEGFSEDEVRASRIAAYVVSRGREQALAAKYGRRLIPDLIRLLESEEKLPDLEKYMELRHNKIFLLDALVRATKMFEGYEEAQLGRDAVYEMMNSPNVVLRRHAIAGAAWLNPKEAIGAWISKLSDPDLSVQVTAASLLGAYGDLKTAALMRRVMQDRARGLSAKEIAKDDSLVWMSTAISEIRDREAGNPGLSTSERMSEADLIKRGGLKTEPPQTQAPPAPIAAHPPTTHEEVQALATPETLLSPPPSAERREPPPDVLAADYILWSAAAGAVALLGWLFIHARRRAP